MTLPIIHTNNKALLFRFEINVFAPMYLSVIGKNAKYGSKVTYFNRMLEINEPGIYEVEFPMPLTPEKLKIEFKNASDGNEHNYKVLSISTDYLPQANVQLDQTETEYLEFIKQFCKEASDLPLGEYRSKKGNFFINYMNGIVDEVEGKIDTPARTDHATGEHQVDRNKWVEMTVPEQMVVLCHERKHYKDDIPHEGATPLESLQAEINCDLDSLRICLGLGFPKSECLHAFTNIFKDTDANIERINIINDYIENFNYKTAA